MACVKINPSENNSLFFCWGVIILKMYVASIVRITNPCKIMFFSNAAEATEAVQFNNKILSAIPSCVRLRNKKHSFAMVTLFSK